MDNLHMRLAASGIHLFHQYRAIHITESTSYSNDDISL